MALSNKVEQGLSQKWKDGFHYTAAGFLIVTAVALAFISFIITLTVGAGVIAWGGLSLGVALTLIGGGMYFHNQLITFETKANIRMEEMSAQINKEFREVGSQNRRLKQNTENSGAEDSNLDL